MAEGAVRIWIKNDWDVKRVDSLYTMVFGRFNNNKTRGFIHLFDHLLSGICIQEGVILLDNSMRNKSRFVKRERIIGRLPFSL